MQRKKVYLGIGLFSLSALVIGALAFTNIKSRAQSMIRNDADEYSLVLDSSTVAEALTTDYQDNVNDVQQTEDGNQVMLHYVMAKKSDTQLVQLAPRGMIYNFNSDSTAGVFHQITGINGITADYSGVLAVRQVKLGQNGAVLLGEPKLLTSGTKETLAPSNYFCVVAGDGGATINSLTVHYSCVAGLDVKNLTGKYTGHGSDNYNYQLTIYDNATVLIESLDMESNVSFNGDVEMTGANTVQSRFTVGGQIVTWNATLADNGNKLAFVSKSGPTAAYVPEIDFYRVHTLDNFESYSATGQGYVNGDTKYATSGLRMNYYADYYTGSGSGPIGGSGWPLMTSTDNTTLLKTKGHNSQGMALKFSNGMSMRYISMNSLYGIPEVMGMGSKMSIWARGGYTNTNFNTNTTINVPITVYAYYATPLTPSNQTTVRSVGDFTVNAGSDWKQYTFDINPSYVYYGFGIYAKQSGGATVYLPIDDVQIWTVNPWSKYEEPINVTGVTLNKSELTLAADTTEELIATVSPADATNKNVTWESSNTNVATVSDGVVRGVSAGNATITVRTQDGGYTATCAVTVTAATTYPSGVFKGIAVVGGNNFSFIVATGAHGEVEIRVNNQSAQATGFDSYNSTTGAFSIATTGSYMSMSFGNITGTYDPVNEKLTNVACTGAISSYVDNNGDITCTKPDYYWDCDGNTATLQATFKRRYMSGSWQVDNTNADRITQNTDQWIGGGASVKRRGYSGGAVAFNLQDDLAAIKTVSNIAYWVYNPSGSDIVLRQWIYKATNFGSNGEIGSVTAKAGQWTYCQMGFDHFTLGTDPLYNFQIADFNNTGVYLSFDNICLF